MTKKKKARGRPRLADSDDVVDAVLAAVLAQIVTRGVTAIRIDEVARTARVNKTTIYRRWPKREDLVLAALRSVRGRANEPPFRETGHTRNDLVALYAMKARVLSTERGRAVARALLAVANAPEAAALAQRLRTERTALAQAIIAKGIARGDVDKGVDAAFLTELILAPIIYRATHALEPYTNDEIARIVDTLLKR